jgi:hypothetical protein
MAGVARDIRNGLEACLYAEAGTEYKELKYLLDLEQNSFTGGQDKRFGVRPGAAPRNDDASVNKSLTYTQTFQFVLTKGHKVTGVSDTEKYEAYLDLHEIALRFNSKVLRTKAGLPSRVLNAINFEIQEPEFLDDKVVVLIGNIDIIYRLAF